jgi:hypothetical protein
MLFVEFNMRDMRLALEPGQFRHLKVVKITKTSDVVDSVDVASVDKLVDAVGMYEEASQSGSDEDGGEDDGNEALDGGAPPSPGPPLGEDEGSVGMPSADECGEEESDFDVDDAGWEAEPGDGAGSVPGAHATPAYDPSGLPFSGKGIRKQLHSAWTAWQFTYPFHAGAKSKVFSWGTGAGLKKSWSGETKERHAGIFKGPSHAFIVYLYISAYIFKKELAEKAGIAWLWECHDNDAIADDID